MLIYSFNLSAIVHILLALLFDAQVFSLHPLFLLGSERENEGIQLLSFEIKVCGKSTFSAFIKLTPGFSSVAIFVVTVLSKPVGCE